VALIGLVSALAVLTHYLMSALPLALGIYLVVSQEDRKRALLAFLAGFLLPLLPWMGWTFHTVGSPFFSLFGYELLAHTRTYPGEMIWRLGTAPPPPFAFLFQHPLDLPHKFLVGLNQFYDTTLDLVNPVVGFLFVGALLSGFAPGPALGGLKVAGSSLLLGVGLSCLFRPEPGLLLAWAPLLAVGAAAALTAWTRRGLESGEWDRFPRWREWLGGMIHLGVILLVGFPLFFFLLISRPGPGPQLAQWAVPVAEQVAAGGVVMTDQPFLVAWYADRPAVWLLQQEEDWERLERTMEAVDALYLTAAWQQIPAPERGRWWYWLASPQGAYRDFAPAPRQWPQGVLRVRDQPEAPPEHGGS
jgi:hypothetical protein